MASKESEKIRAMLINEIAPKFTADVPLPIQGETLEAMNSQAGLPVGVTVTPTKVLDMYAEWVSGPDTDRNKVILHLHGGGHAIGSCNTHRELAARISLASKVPVLLIEYRLAPPHHFPADIEDATAAYRWLLGEGFKPNQIIISGDSAGGGLTMSTLLSLRDAGDPLPAAAILLSAWVDLAVTGETIKTRAEIDPWLTPDVLHVQAANYIGNGDASLTDPLVSPLYADLHGLPPLLIHMGDHEILLSDATRLAEKAEAAGVEVTLDVWPDMWHVWHFSAAELPEGQQAIDKIGAFVQQKLA